MDPSAQVLARRDPRPSLGSALGREQAVPLVQPTTFQTAGHLVDARVDLVLLSWQAHEALLRQRRAVSPTDVCDHLQVVAHQLVRRLVARLVVVEHGAYSVVEAFDRHIGRAALLSEKAPAEVLLLESQLRQHRLHRRARLLTHVGLAVLKARRVLHLLRRRVDAGAQELGRCDPGRRLRAIGRLELLRRHVAEEPSAHLFEEELDEKLHPRQAHETLLRGRRAVGPTDVIHHLDHVGEHLTGGLLARAVVVLDGRSGALRRDERVVEAVPEQALLLRRHLRQHRLGGRRRVLVHVRLAVLVSGSAHRLLRRRVDAGAQILGCCDPRRGLRCALGREQAVPGVRVAAD